MNKPENNQGWIKLHRKLLDNAVSDNPRYAWLWVCLLLMANHTEKEFIWNNKKIIIKKGQLLTGLKSLSVKSGIAQGTVYRILKYLENEKQIEQQKTTKFTIITILNWDIYQQDEKQNGKQIENRLKTDEKQIETNKNVKNVKNVENVKNIHREFIEFFNLKLQTKYQLTSKVISQINTRVDEGFTLEDFKVAIKNAMGDKYLMGKNTNKRRYLTPEYITRPDKLQDWLNSDEKGGEQWI